MLNRISSCFRDIAL